MVMKILFCLLCLYYNVIADNKFKLHPVVSTIYGDVRGSVMKSRDGRFFSAFRGMPYAKPPIGDLRFKAPEEPDSWEEPHDATENGNICIQQNYLFSQNPEIEGSEDCLFINVYTPLLRIYVQNSKLVKPKTGNLLPVMVFFHYGAFMAGSSSSDVLGPDYLMDRDVVLVTFNYRLGVFGFFSTYDDVAPGNWAFKDQIAALKWVQKNIAEFGGDPKQVTIFGQSAGAGSVHFHLLNQREEGLFHAAISQSGSALALWAQPQRELLKVIANYQANVVGCTTNTTIEMVECLRAKPAAELVASMNLLRHMRSEPLTVFVPAIETESEENPEPFITKDPIDVIENEEFINVPWIIGVTADEGILRAAPFVRQTDLLDTINEKFDSIFDQMMYLQLSVDANQTAETVNRIKEFYLQNESRIDVNSSKSIQGLINLYSDRGFLYPIYQTALMHRHKGHENMWVYHFDYKGSRSYGELYAATENDVDFEWGVCHSDDLIYLFNSPKYFPNFTMDHNDIGMSTFMLNLFTNLAIYHHPTPGLNAKETWRPLPPTTEKKVLKNTDLHFLRIKGDYRSIYNIVTVRMSNIFVPERMSFWRSLPLKENIEIIV